MCYWIFLFLLSLGSSVKHKRAATSSKNCILDNIQTATELDRQADVMSYALNLMFIGPFIILIVE